MKNMKHIIQNNNVLKIILIFLMILLICTNVSANATVIEEKAKKISIIKNEEIQSKKIATNPGYQAEKGKSNKDSSSKQKTEAEKKTNDSSAANSGLGSSDSKSSHTIDEVIKESNSFLETGKNTGILFNGSNLNKGSDTLFNILLVVGIGGTVIVGIYLGIKFMMASAEDKAKVKESLVPYIAGCIVIYGAFTIWKVVISLLELINK